MTPAAGHPRPIEVVAFGLGIAYFAAYQLFKLPVVLPVLLERYHYDRTLAGGFMSIYALAGLSLSIWLGRAVARRGPAPYIAVALGLSAAGSVLTVLLPSSALAMLSGRALEGIAFAILAIGGPVIANAGATPERLPIIIGLTATWIPIGQLTAILLAPVSLATVGWQSLWYAGLGAAVLFALWTARLRRAPGLAPGGAIDPVGEHRRAFTPAERRLLALSGTVFMLWSGQYFAYMTWLPQYLVEVTGLSVTSALVGYLIPVVFVLIFNVVAGLMLRAGFAAGVMMAGALACQALVWWLMPATGSGLGFGIVSLVAYGVGAGIVPVCLFAMPSAILGRARGTAGAFGVIMTGRNLGVLIGPVLLAQAVDMTGSWALATPIFGTLTTVGLAISLALAAGLRRRGDAPPRG